MKTKKNIDSEFNSKIQTLLNRYGKTKKPITVSFRAIVQDFNVDRATHLIHTYPAKLLPQIPYFFINNDLLSKKGDIVLDPFCGSGTVLLEALLAGRNAIGADTNPLARLISKVKTDRYEIKDLKRTKHNLAKRIQLIGEATTPPVVNIDYWFLPHVKKQLSILLMAIKKVRNNETRDFFLVCLSNCVKKVSLADPRISVPVRLKKNQYDKDHPFHADTITKLNQLKSIDVISKFFEIVDLNIKRYEDYYGLLNQNQCTVKNIFSDSRNLYQHRRLGAGTVDLIISSPPYAGAQKYIRASSLSLCWLELAMEEELKELDKLTIGRENYRSGDYKQLMSTSIDDANKALKLIWKANPLRAHIAANYLVEMEDALAESVRALKQHGYFVLIAANNFICGKNFKTEKYLCAILEKLGLTIKLKLIDDIKSYGLMTKRNKTASIITREWITIFQKSNK